MKKFPLILITILAATQAYARLGWTLEECEKQYGYPVGDLGLAAHQGYEFNVGNYVLTIDFKNGKAATIVYRFKTKGIFPPPIVADIVAKNCPGVTWEKATLDQSASYTERDGHLSFDCWEYCTTQYSIRNEAHPELYSVKCFAHNDANDISRIDIYRIGISVRQPEEITPGL